MGLFSRHTYSIGGNVKAYERDYTPCGAACGQCGAREPGCTKSLGHSTTFDGHMSNAATTVNGVSGCGHTWR